jgi:hypothetical protein
MTPTRLPFSIDAHEPPPNDVSASVRTVVPLRMNVMAGQEPARLSRVPPSPAFVPGAAGPADPPGDVPELGGVVLGDPAGGGGGVPDPGETTTVPEPKRQASASAAVCSADSPLLADVSAGEGRGALGPVGLSADDPGVSLQATASAATAIVAQTNCRFRNIVLSCAGLAVRELIAGGSLESSRNRPH